MAQNNGILTETHRKYLQDEHTPPSDSAERKMRSDIRDRTLAALEDLESVANGLEKRDVELLFREPEPVRNTLEEDQSRVEAYKQMVSILAFCYEVHLRKGWDFSDTLRLALEQAHSRENPRDLPHRKVNKEEFEFTPALESPETFKERIERIEEKIHEGEEPLTDEERLFYIESQEWESTDELDEFLQEQKDLRRACHELEKYTEPRPWIDDK